MAKITTFLMFTGQAAEAIELYISAFSGARLVRCERWAAGEAGAPGTVKQALLALPGQDLLCFDSPPVHAFGFTPAISLFVTCEAEEELERLFATLGEGGEVLMPPGDYGFSRRFTWFNDRFGVSWQLDLPHA